MQRLSAQISCALLLAVLAVAFGPLRAEGSADHTQTFVSSAIRNLGAKSVRCPRQVRAAVQSRRMVAVCASFDGDFEMFRERWAERMELAPPPGVDQERSRMPQARTSWEHRNGTYERIYAVGETAVGVRFTRGELMLVYAE